jgi:hypothetical protein
VQPQRHGEAGESGAHDHDDLAGLFLLLHDCGCRVILNF